MINYESLTIKKMLEDIDSDKLIIPTIQRNFVWPKDKIIDLFDSIMRSYPIGTFLFWDITEDTFAKFYFSKIIRFHQERYDKKYRSDKVETQRTEYFAVLDGQQRLSSLNIGILGSIKTHIKGTKWDNQENYQEEFLCFNILHCPKDDEEDTYDFDFVAEDNINKLLDCTINEGADDEKIIKNTGLKLMMYLKKRVKIFLTSFLKSKMLILLFLIMLPVV